MNNTATSTTTTYFECVWVDCPVITDDIEEIETHIDEHDERNGYNA